MSSFPPFFLNDSLGGFRIVGTMHFTQQFEDVLPLIFWLLLKSYFSVQLLFVLRSSALCLGAFMILLHV